MISFFTIVIEQAFIYIPLIFGAYISFSLLKTPDLSIESAYLFGALFAGLNLQITQGYPLPFVLTTTLAASILGGLVVGATSSCITFFGNIPHLLSSIITFGLYHGIFQLISRPYASLAPYSNPLMVTPQITHHPELLSLGIISITLCIGLAVLLRSQLGHSFSIFGVNPLFFKHFRISTSYVFIAGILLANSLAGLAGYLFAQTNNLVEINMGIGKSLFCITALVLGNACITRQKPSLLKPLCGIFSYFLLQQALIKTGFNLKYFTAIQALLILIILLVFYKRTNTSIDQLGV